MNQTYNNKSDLPGFLIYLYRYHITLKNIVNKLRRNQRGRNGQLTEEEINFIRPLYEQYESYVKRLDST